MEQGQGLALLIGDLGVAHESITIIKPDGATVRLTSGSKPEYGPGGFETYANLPGTYQIQFLDQNFEIPLSGSQFTRVTFTQVADPASVQVKLSLRDRQSSYGVGEKVFVIMEVTNVSPEPVSFGILGLLTSTDHFQTSWDNGLIQAGQTFRHEDGLTFAAPGVYKLRLSICLARKEACLGTDEGWVRFKPGVQVVVHGG